MTKAEYDRSVAERSMIILQNKSRRLRGLPILPVPHKPSLPMVRIAYESDGTYAGRLLEGEVPPPGCIVRTEQAKW